MAADRDAAAPTLETVQETPASAATAALPGSLPARILALQRGAGNAAVSRAIAGGTLQRDDKPDIPVTDVTLSAGVVTVPAESGLSLKASAVPANATGVTWSAEKGTVEATGTTVDSAGKIAVADAQPGGEVTIKATAKDKTTASLGLILIEKPTTLTQTSGSVGGSGSDYEAQFLHTFTGKSGTGAAVDDINFNEKFDSLSASGPFGDFTLKANASNAKGWHLNASGQMTGADNVSIGKAMIDAGKFVASASNPKPAKTLPQSFSMTQHLHAKSLPSGKLDAASFKDVAHVRGLADPGTGLEVQITAGETVSIPYEGPPVFTKAKASASKVEASPPKPKTEPGKNAPTWSQNEVTVTVDATPSSATPVFSFVGAALGCTIDASSGVVKIGATPGTITVRAGGKTNFDEVSIEITAPPAKEKSAQAESESPEDGPVHELPV